MRRCTNGVRSLARISGVTLLLLTVSPFGRGALALSAGSERPAAEEGPARTPAGAPSTGKWVIVVCAPGYPGNTVQAQPTMDLLAKYVEKAAGLAPGSLGAVYYETEKGGLDRLAANDAALSLVPLPFYLQHEAKLALKPLLTAEPESGPTEQWGLVAKKGRVTSASSLAGWEVASLAGYAPAFVRGTALGGWGALPATTKITFTAGMLSTLRRIAAGENIAVLLNREQTASLSNLPFASNLEVVTRSNPLPASVLCAIEERLAPAQRSRLVDALTRMHENPEGTAVLKELRLKRFASVDLRALDAARQSFRRASTLSK
jgi:ABC-type phosphate/phosphonate transport system substrate-binding protein